MLCGLCGLAYTAAECLNWNEIRINEKKKNDIKTGCTEARLYRSTGNSRVRMFGERLRNAVSRNNIGRRHFFSIYFFVDLTYIPHSASFLSLSLFIFFFRTQHLHFVMTADRLHLYCICNKNLIVLFTAYVISGFRLYE